MIPVVAIALFLFFLSNKTQPVPEHQGAVFGNLDITQSILAPTNTMSTFKAKLPLQMNVSIIEDHIWERTLENMLAGAVKVDEVPVTFPIFDLSILTADQKRYKIWDENESLILMNVETKEVYASNTIDAANLLGMMHRLSEKWNK